MKPHRGTLILVLGILGIILCPPIAIAAWIMGKGELKQKEAGTMDPEGRGNTNVGRILGIIGTILIIVGIVIGVISFVVGIALIGTAGAGGY